MIESERGNSKPNKNGLMQTIQENNGAGLRLAMLAGGSSLVIGSVVWLMISFWPRPTPSLPAEAGSAERPVTAAAASEPVKAVTGTNPVSRTKPGAGRQPVVGSMDPAARPPGPNGNRTPRPLPVVTLTDQNQIRGPLPWRNNGPPVRTPQPGASAAKAPNAGNASPAISPNGANRNVRGQTLPFLAPARRNPGPIPDAGVQRTESGAPKAE